MADTGITHEFLCTERRLEALVQQVVSRQHSARLQLCCLLLPCVSCFMFVPLLWSKDPKAPSRVVMVGWLLWCLQHVNTYFGLLGAPEITESFEMQRGDGACPIGYTLADKVVLKKVKACVFQECPK